MFFIIGMCLGDNNDSFNKARAAFFNDILTLPETEAFSLQKSIDCIQSLKVHNVIFETDCCKMIINHLGASRNGLLDFNVILTNCKQSLLNSNKCSVGVLLGDKLIL